MAEEIEVIKCTHLGKEVWRYTGRVVSRQPNAILVEALFTRPIVDVNGMVLKQGDRFLELYFSDRWYNIFEIYEGETDRVKGWYCNVTCPAVIRPDAVIYRDLALDLLVFPDGRRLVLDEDEFADLNLDRETIAKAWKALEELELIFNDTRLFSLEVYFQNNFRPQTSKA